MNANQRRRIEAILGRQLKGSAFLEESSQAFDRAIYEMRSVLNAMQLANDKQREALRELIEEHREAEQLRDSDTH